MSRAMKAADVSIELMSFLYYFISIAKPLKNVAFSKTSNDDKLLEIYYIPSNSFDFNATDMSTST